MKEKELDENKIINTLADKRFILISPICHECLKDLTALILDVFTYAEFDVRYISDELYSVRISV